MKISEILNGIDRNTLAKLLQKSDVMAFSGLGFNYLIIALCFASVAYFPHFLTWVVASAILSGRQLGLAILMHDCAHNGYFKTTAFNSFFGKWFCAAPVFADLDRYRTYHLEHHRTAGSEADPDRSNYVAYPVPSSSLLRKFVRDMVGITGLKIFMIIIQMNAGIVAYQLSYDQNKKRPQIPLIIQLKNVFKGLFPTFFVHVIAIQIFIFLNHAEAYLLWWLAWFTFYMAFSRLRNAAEHGATANIHDLNPLFNTRTTLAAWWERVFVAPNYVNYHLEHHLLPTIPPYNLSKFHHILNEKGILQNSRITKGYARVIKELTAYGAKT